MTIKFEKINVENVSDEQWNKIHFIRKELKDMDSPDEPLTETNLGRTL